MSISVQPVTTFAEVVVATDFSKEAERALEYAKAIARRFHSEVLAVHVGEPVNPIVVPESEWYYNVDVTPDDEEAAAVVEEELRREGLKATAVCPRGVVAEEIVRLAESSNADLVITGSHARRGTKRWLHGSISEAVARKLHVPLLIVGPKAAQLAGGEWRPLHLLCASCIDDKGEAVATYTDALATELGACWELTCDYPGGAETSLAWDEFKADLEAKLPRVNGKPRSLQSAFLSEPHAESLTEVATDRKADLIVIGRSHPFLKWSLLRSGTLPHLLAEAPCAVLVLPEQPL